MAVGNAGYGDAIKGATAAGDTAKAAGDTAKAASQASKAAALTKMSNIATSANKLNKYAPIIQGAAGALNSTSPQQPLNLGPAQEGIRNITPYVSPMIMNSKGKMGKKMSGAGGPANQSGYSNEDNEGMTPLMSGGAQQGPIMFRQQPLTQKAAFNYLGRYGINS